MLIAREVDGDACAKGARIETDAVTAKALIDQGHAAPAPDAGVAADHRDDLNLSMRVR